MKPTKTFKGFTYEFDAIDVLSNGNIITGCEFGIELWNPETGECIRPTKQMNEVSLVKNLPNNKFAIGNDESNINVYDSTTCKLLSVVPLINEYGVATIIFRLIDEMDFNNRNSNVKFILFLHKLYQISKNKFTFFD